MTDDLQLLGWKYVAAQKLKPGTRDDLIALQLALPTDILINQETGQIIENDPVMMPKTLADFCISRLARELAHEKLHLPVTFENSPHFASLYKGGINLPDKRHHLVSSLITAAIPDCLDTLEPGTYWKLRADYADVRKSLNKLVSQTMATHDLDGSDDFHDFIRRTDIAVTNLRKDIDKAASKVVPVWWEKTRGFALDTSFALMGTYIGNGFGAFAGTVAGTGFSRLSRNVSNFFTTRSDDLASQIGHVRARINQASYRPDYRVPNYMV